jgi:growth hormone-inducible transmembrane protein
VSFLSSPRMLSALFVVCSNDKYLYMGGPLLAGVTVVALTSLAPMALPLGTRALAITESISLYGGLAVFSGFVLYEYVTSSSWWSKH